MLWKDGVPTENGFYWFDTSGGVGKFSIVFFSATYKEFTFFWGNQTFRLNERTGQYENDGYYTEIVRHCPIVTPPV